MYAAHSQAARVQSASRSASSGARSFADLAIATSDVGSNSIHSSCESLTWWPWIDLGASNSERRLIARGWQVVARCSSWSFSQRRAMSREEHAQKDPTYDKGGSARNERQRSAHEDGGNIA